MYPKPPRKRKRRLVVSREQRERILRRAGGRCEHCGALPDFRGLQIHHLTNRGMGGTRQEYQDDELIALAAKCHSAEHGIREV